MEHWSDGYMTDIAYTYGYYNELNPLRARLALLSGGYAFPKFETACELGFGQGLSVNIHDAASGTDWYGTDFNPSHAGFARELAADTPLAGRLFDEAFAEFCQRSDLPDFDFIGMHGIWSWVSDANRAVMADFIKRKLKVGGVLYISYNTQPGWAPIMPLRELIMGYNETMAVPGAGTADRVEASLDFAARLLDSGAQYGVANPAVARHLDTMRKHDRTYLAHEYFNRDWMPMSFAGIAKWLEFRKLQFAGSAHFLDHVPRLNLTEPQRTLLGDIPDPNFRESVRDTMVNQLFRRDYWVRGMRRLSTVERNDKLREVRVILAKPVTDVPLSAAGALGPAALSTDVYGPILDYLGDHQVHTLRDIEHACKGRNLHLGHVIEAVIVLVGIGVLFPAQDVQAISQAKPQTDGLNKRLMEMAVYSETVKSLASPVTGGALPVDRLEQLFLLARSRGAAAQDDWARFAGHVLDAHGQRIVRDGKAIASAEDQIQELSDRAARMVRTTLPIYQAFGIVD